MANHGAAQGGYKVPLRDVEYNVANSKSNQECNSHVFFVLVKYAGAGEVDGVYRPSGRRWLETDVLQGCSDEFIISREAQTNAKTGVKRYGFVLGRNGKPLYGAPTEILRPPAGRWKVLPGGLTPAPEIETFPTLTETCRAGAEYFAAEADNAAKSEHWDAVLALANRAFDYFAQAWPKGFASLKGEANEKWATQLADLLVTRADAWLRLDEYFRALVDACSALHFVQPFEWSRARTRGTTACLSLGVTDDQAKLFMEEASKRDIRVFPGVQELETWVTAMLQQARGKRLRPVELKDETPDDGRIYFRVVDPDECKLRPSCRFGDRALGTREFGDLLRGERISEDGAWLELHASEPYDDSNGDQRAFVPIFTEGSEEERDEILERCTPSEYPRIPSWERLGLQVAPLGLKPPTDMELSRDFVRWKDEPRREKKIDSPYIYKHGLAIATMLRGAPEFVIDSFVRYHWGIGFNHIFLFFDDPNDPGIEVATELQEMCTSKSVEAVGISVIRMDAEWWTRALETSRFFQRRDKNDMYESVCRQHERYGDIESRQMIVIDQAIVDAHQMGIDWFAPLDIDECIYVKQCQDCSARHFLGSKPRSVLKVRLWNNEAVPEESDCEDWFRDCTLFKINLNHCKGFTPPREYDFLLRRREGRELEPEPANSDTSWFTELCENISCKRQKFVKANKLTVPPVLREMFPYFTSYHCGKNIVRLEKHMNPPIPFGVRDFLADNGEMLRDCYQANSPSDAVVLHYPNACYSHWQEKYKTLGPIPHALREDRDMTNFHLASSDVHMQRDQRRLKEFYKTFVMQDEQSELAYLAEYGLVQRINGVKLLLDSWDEPAAADEPLPGQQRWLHPSGLQLAAPNH